MELIQVQTTQVRQTTTQTIQHPRQKQATQSGRQTQLLQIPNGILVFSLLLGCLSEENALLVIRPPHCPPFFLIGYVLTMYLFTTFRYLCLPEYFAFPPLFHSSPSTRHTTPLLKDRGETCKGVIPHLQLAAHEEHTCTIMIVEIGWDGMDDKQSKNVKAFDKTRQGRQMVLAHHHHHNMFSFPLFHSISCQAD